MKRTADPRLICPVCGQIYPAHHEACPVPVIGGPDGWDNPRYWSPEKRREVMGR